MCRTIYLITKVYNQIQSLFLEESTIAFNYRRTGSSNFSVYLFMLLAVKCLTDACITQSQHPPQVSLLRLVLRPSKTLETLINMSSTTQQPEDLFSQYLQKYVKQVALYIAKQRVLDLYCYVCLSCRDFPSFPILINDECLSLICRGFIESCFEIHKIQTFMHTLLKSKE